MKEVDTTPIPEAESDESEKWFIFEVQQKSLAEMYLKRIKKLEKRVANLEAQKPPQDLSSDPEWFA